MTQNYSYCTFNKLFIL